MTNHSAFQLGDDSLFRFGRLVGAIAISTLVASQSPGSERLVVYVDQAAAPGGDGTSWSHAYTDLQDGLDRQRELASQQTPVGSTLKIAHGIYRPDRGTGARDQPFFTDWLAHSVSIEIRGGYAGVGGIDPERRDFVRTPTILSGDLQGDDGPDFSNRSDNSIIVFSVGPVYADDGAILIEGLEFSGAAETAADAPYGYVGSAVVVYGVTSPENLQTDTPSILFESCTFKNNRMLTSFGAAMRISGNGVELRDCRFASNRNVNGSGGAIAWYAMYSATLPISMKGCTFEDNEARIGGALVIGGGALSMDRVVFANNRAAIDGGAAFIESQLEVTNSLFLANEAGNTGGAIACISTAEIDLRNCTLVENRANSGAAIQSGYGPLVATNSIFWHNHAGGANPIVDLWPGFNPTWQPPVLDGVLLDGGLGSVRLPAGLNAPVGQTIQSNPEFIRERLPADDASAWRTWNYRLRIGSPAGGTGAIAIWGLPISDLDGRPSAWPKGSQADMGCYFLSTSDCAANLNRDTDQFVDDADFTEFVVAYNFVVSPPANPQADLNRDGLVDDADFSIFLQAYDALMCP